MFTGLIEEIGEIGKISKVGNAAEIKITSSKIIQDINIDDSISVNGVCLTVTSFDENSFNVTAVDETLRKTTIGSLKNKSKVNLERAMDMKRRFGGHIVQGHVDTTAILSNVVKETKNYLLYFNYDNSFRKYIVPMGSITVNGISLTVADVDDNNFKIAIIPHTWDNTNINKLKNGDSVNIEFDILGKYVENIMLYHKDKPSNLEELLKNYK